MIVAAIPLVDMDAAGLDPGQLFEIGDDRPQRVTVERVAVQRLGVKRDALIGLCLDRSVDLLIAITLMAILPVLGRSNGRLAVE